MCKKEVKNLEDSAKNYLKQATQDSAKSYLVKLGIVTKNGNLTRQYSARQACIPSGKG